MNIRVSSPKQLEKCRNFSKDLGPFSLDLTLSKVSAYERRRYVCNELSLSKVAAYERTS